MKRARKSAKSVRRTPKRRTLTDRVEVLEGEMSNVKVALAALRGVPAQLIALQNDFMASQGSTSDQFAHLEALFIDESERVKQAFSDHTDRLMKALGALPCSKPCSLADTQPYEPMEVEK